MPHLDPWHPGLDRLQRRLGGGAAASIAGLRRGGPGRPASIGVDVETSHRSGRLTAADQKPMWELLRQASKLADGPTVGTVEGSLDGISAHLRGDRELLLAVLLSPRLAMMATAEKSRELSRREVDPHTAAITEWFWLCWLAEAAWRAVAAEPASGGTALIGDDRRLLHPVASRLRFLVLSEPFRHRPDQDDPDQGDGWRLESDYGDMGYAGLAFGSRSAHLLLDRCRAARRAWQGCLDEYQSHPLLAVADSDELEAELDQLLFADPSVSKRRPFTTRPPGAGGAHTQNRQDRTSVNSLVETHLLPRFKVWRAAQVAAAASRTARSSAALVIVLVVVTLGTVGAGSFQVAAVLACGAYAVLGAGTLLHGQSWSAPWLLRIPAANALGVFTLITLHPQWWQSSSHWPVASLVLLLTSLGYLTVEARNHGVDATRAWLRALGITAIGTVHALLVALIGLVLVAPEYAEDGAALDSAWHSGVWHGGGGWSVLASGAAWCLAIGVFSQILWDDRPITAPLAHLRWQRGG